MKTVTQKQILLSNDLECKLLVFFCVLMHGQSEDDLTCKSLFLDVCAFVFVCVCVLRTILLVWVFEIIHMFTFPCS